MAKLYEVTHFDQDAFLKLILNDSQLFSDLLELFIQDWPPLVVEIRQAIAGNDFKLLERSAHRLKGNIRNFYASKAAGLALKLEEAGRKGETRDLEQLVVELENELTLLVEELKQFCATMR